VTGPEHYQAAEEHLGILLAEKDHEAWLEALRTGELATALQAAQVHATLALAAATALNDGKEGMTVGDWNDWLMMCGIDSAVTP
jgi:hypothetical protein